MAVIWSKQTSDTLYEVRSAGATVRLYSNGVLHSQYNPNHVISGAIWDLLLLPGFCLEAAPKNILLLGLGGGTLVHMIRHFFPSANITCVELDSTHIQVAKRWFKLPKKGVRVIHGDAYEYLVESRETFDWIVDDVFQHVSGDPQRGFPLQQAKSRYEKRLTPNGILSLNLIGSAQFKNALTFLQAGRFNQALQFSHPLYENRILCLMPENDLDKRAASKAIKTRMNAHGKLDQSKKACRLKYKMQWA